MFLQIKSGLGENYSVVNSLETSLPSEDLAASSTSEEDCAGFWLASAISQVLGDYKEMLIPVICRRRKTPPILNLLQV